MADIPNPAQFLNEAWLELKKSTWLSRQQAIGSTGVVLTLVAIVAVYIAGVDFLLSLIMGALLGR
ncbi:MAG: preprotein translocase subunit SecE [Elusimicrobia bacterium]|nr:MAG: preprotein translocase subunit SecE [Elusimicrobiota bacterium]